VPLARRKRRALPWSGPPSARRAPAPGGGEDQYGWFAEHADWHWPPCLAPVLRRSWTVRGEPHPLSIVPAGSGPVNPAW